MGNKYEVYSWVCKKRADKRDDDRYEFVNVYSGESFKDALITMFAEKAKGVGCVKLEYR